MILNVDKKSLFTVQYIHTSYIKGEVLGTKVLFKGYSHGKGLWLLLWHHGMRVLLESKVSYYKGTIYSVKVISWYIGKV